MAMRDAVSRASPSDTTRTNLESSLPRRIRLDYIYDVHDSIQGRNGPEYQLPRATVPQTPSNFKVVSWYLLANLVRPPPGFSLLYAILPITAVRVKRKDNIERGSERKAKRNDVLRTVSHGTVLHGSRELETRAELKHELHIYMYN